MNSSSAGSVQSAIFVLSMIAAVVLLVVLNVEHRVDVGRWYRSSDITRVRVAVLVVGDLALVILSFQNWIVGGSLAALTGALFTLGIESGNWGFERSR